MVYYTESILAPTGFTAYPCASYANFTAVSRFHLPVKQFCYFSYGNYCIPLFLASLVADIYFNINKAWVSFGAGDVRVEMSIVLCSVYFSTFGLSVPLVVRILLTSIESPYLWYLLHRMLGSIELTLWMLTLHLHCAHTNANVQSCLVSSWYPYYFLTFWPYDRLFSVKILKISFVTCIIKESFK